MSEQEGVPRVCPHCDATLRNVADRCWLCGATLEASTTTPFAKEPASTVERRIVGQFSLASLLLIITLLTVVLGVARLAPGAGIALALVTVPALIRTVIVVTLKKRRGSAMNIADKATLFVASLGGAFVILVAAAVAFYLTCWGGFLGGAAVSSTWSAGYGRIGWGMGTGITLGVIAALIVVYFLIRVMWVRRRKPSIKTNDVPS